MDVPRPLHVNDHFCRSGYSSVCRCHAHCILMTTFVDQVIVVFVDATPISC
jgi:hypothetical protein